jgi:xylulokinase
MQLVSDICGIAQHIPQQQIGAAFGAAFGDAFLAGVGAGLFGSTQEASRWVQLGEPVLPNAAAHARYAAFYALYGEAYRQTAGIMHRLHDLAGAMAPP